MASKSIRLNKSLMEKVAYRVNELMMEEYKSDPCATLEGYVPSEKYTKAMEELVYNFKVRRISKPVKTIILIAAIIAALMGCAMSVTAVRRAVREFFLQIGNNHAVVTCDVEKDTRGAVVEELSEIEIYYEPSYVPDGFEKAEVIKLDIQYEITYTDGDNKCCYYQELPMGKITVDNENDELYSTTINGCSAFYVVDSEDGMIYLRWSDNTYTYAIIFNLSEIELDNVIKMAESIKPVD